MSDGNKGPDLHVVGGRQGAPEAQAAWETREAWLEDGRRLGERTERDRWALGDWVVHGEREYGDLAAAATEINVAAKTLSNLASVARKIETSRRREVLSWSHHAEIASLPVDVGDALLDRAEAEGWSHAVMREKARAASEVAQLEARLRKLSDENEQLHREKAPETAEEKARDAVRQTLTRMKAEGRVVNDAVRRTATMFMGLGDKKVAGSLHGNRRSGLARDSARAFAALSAQTRNARADVAHTIGLIAKDGKSPAEASVTALLDEIEEAMREITRRLDAAELNPAQAKAVSDAFNARMDALKTIVTGDVHEALNRKLNGEC